MRTVAGIIAVGTVCAVSGAALRAGNSAFPGSARRLDGGCTDNSDFDYLMHVQQWPPTVCSDQFNCEFTPLDQFTMHGFWPNNDDGSYPCYCSNTQFEISDVSDLLTDMYNQWPSYKCGYGDQTCDGSFWGHEWSKHGSCTADAGITDVHGYFSTTLGLLNTTSLAGALSNAGYYPDDTQTYSTDDIRKAAGAAVGADVELQCDSSKLLEVIIVCYDKSLNVQDCPSSDQQCTEDYIKIPKTPSSRR
jgi:ribonuclease T2